VWLLLSQFLFLHKCLHFKVHNFFTFAITKPPFSLTDTATSRLQTIKYSTNKYSTLYKVIYPYLQSTQKQPTDTVAQGLYGQSIFFQAPPCSAAYGIRDLLPGNNNFFSLFHDYPLTPRSKANTIYL
jgi:hypothetical protein